MQPKQFKEVSKTIDEAINRLVNKSLSYTIQILQKRAVNVQSKFFSYLATSAGVLGRSTTNSMFSMPAIDAGTPMGLGATTWPQLDPYYNIRKGKGENRFFLYTGKLKNDLRGQNAVSKFGLPMIQYFDEDGNLKASSLKTRMGVRTRPGFNKNQPLGHISIDLFPRVTGELKVDMGPAFYKKFFSSYGMGYKMDNWRSKRPFMGQYMEWWIKVKGLQIVRGIT